MAWLLGPSFRIMVSDHVGELQLCQKRRILHFCGNNKWLTCRAISALAELLVPFVECSDINVVQDVILKILYNILYVQDILKSIYIWHLQDSNYPGDTRLFLKLS